MESFSNVFEMNESDRITHIVGILGNLVADYNISAVDAYLVQYDLSLLSDQCVIALLMVTNRIKHELTNRESVYNYLVENNKFVDPESIKWLHNLK